MRPPISKQQKEILEYIRAFYQEYPDMRPSLRDMCTGYVGDRQICKPRASRETARGLVKFLCDKGYLEEKFYRNVAYWVPTEARDG